MAEHGRNLARRSAREPRDQRPVAARRPARPAAHHARGPRRASPRASGPRRRSTPTRPRSPARACTPAGTTSRCGCSRCSACAGSAASRRMDSLSRDEYRAAEPDPTAPIAAKSVAHLNKDHADGLLLIAREIAGARGAVSAVCTGIDRYGIDLSCTGAGQSAAARALFAEPLAKAADVRPATVALVQRAPGSARRPPAEQRIESRHAARRRRRQHPDALRHVPRRRARRALALRDRARVDRRRARLDDAQPARAARDRARGHQLVDRVLDGAGARARVARDGRALPRPHDARGRARA